MPRSPLPPSALLPPDLQQLLRPGLRTELRRPGPELWLCRPELLRGPQLLRSQVLPRSPLPSSALLPPLVLQQLLRPGLRTELLRRLVGGCGAPVRIETVS